MFALFAVLAVALTQCGGTKYKSDGEAIYMSGKTLDGTVVKNEVDRSGLPNPTIVLSCAGCHGADAHGKKNAIPAFGPYVAPNITWEALTGGDPATAYNEHSLATAIRTGIVPEGYRLHFPMPKWNLTDKQMKDLIAYLKTKH